MVCCIIYTQQLSSFFQVVLCCQLKCCQVLSSTALFSQESHNILWGFIRSESMLYRSIKFDEEWFYSFCPPFHYYLLVERKSSCTFSSLLKRNVAQEWLCEGTSWSMMNVQNSSSPSASNKRDPGSLIELFIMDKSCHSLKKKPDCYQIGCQTHHFI